MQKVMNPPEVAVRWPWSAEDIAAQGDEARAPRTLIWQRTPLWVIIVWLVGVIVFLYLGFATDARVFHHNLDTQSSWIAQASQQEVACLHYATTDAQRTLCAQTLAAAVTTQQTQFDRSHIAWGGDMAASEMHSAFDALYAAACYDADTGSADMACLHATAPMLRAWAVQDATTATTE